MIDKVLSWIPWVIVFGPIALAAIVVFWLIGKFISLIFDDLIPSPPPVPSHNSRDPQKEEVRKKKALQAKYSGMLQPLVQFAGQDHIAFAEAAEKLWPSFAKLDRDVITQLLSPKGLLMFDLIVLIKKIALPSDQIRPEDVELLRVYCRECDLDLLLRFTEPFLKEVGDMPVTILGLMKLIDTAGAQELAGIYVDLAKVIGRNPGTTSMNIMRKTAYKDVVAGLQEVMTSSSVLPSEEHQNASKQSISAEDVARYDLLGAGISCSLKELKAAYHAKMAAWHPDKLAHMAPELQEFATQQVVKINEAYEAVLQSHQTQQMEIKPTTSPVRAQRKHARRSSA